MQQSPATWPRHVHRFHVMSVNKSRDAARPLLINRWKSTTTLRPSLYSRFPRMTIRSNPCVCVCVSVCVNVWIKCNGTDRLPVPYVYVSCLFSVWLWLIADEPHPCPTLPCIVFAVRIRNIVPVAQHFLLQCPVHCGIGIQHRSREPAEGEAGPVWKSSSGCAGFDNVKVLHFSAWSDTGKHALARAKGTI